MALIFIVIFKAELTRFNLYLQIVSSSIFCNDIPEYLYKLGTIKSYKFQYYVKRYCQQN